jgi:hypothetical protein
MSTTNSNKQKGLRSVGLIIGLVWAFVYAGVWLTSYASAVSHGEYSLGLILLIVVPLITIGGLTIAWKRSLIGGVALIVGGLFLAAYSPMINMSAVAIMVTSLPPLASGILFLLSWGKGNEYL